MIKKIDSLELYWLLNSEDHPATLVDVLDEEHYEKEHIKGALSLPLNRIEKEAKEVLSKDDNIVVYCASSECKASLKAAEKFKDLGFKRIYDYTGGLKDFKRTGLPLEGSLYK